MSLKNDLLRKLDAVATHLEAARRVVENDGTIKDFTYAINNLRDEIDELMKDDEDILIALGK
jgi:hypothetical protein